MFNRSFLIIVLLAIVPLSLFGQMPISISGSLGGGILSPQSSNIKGNIYSVYDYPLSNTGYLFGAKLRVGLLAMPISFTGTLSYNSLSDEATIPVTTGSGVVNSKYTPSLSILTIGVGAEYSLFPAPVIKPYASANVAMNIITGASKYENNIIPESKMNSTNRIGIALGVGSLIEVPLFPVSFDIEAKYNFANLSGKEFNNNGLSYNGFGGIPQTTSYNLNDGKNPNDSKDHDRSINYLTVMLSVNFKIF